MAGRAPECSIGVSAGGVRTKATEQDRRSQPHSSTSLAHWSTRGGEEGAGLPNAESGLQGPPAAERLLDAVVAAADEVGYTALTVQQVLARAGLSRATFYQYYRGLDDCFWDAYRREAGRLCRALSAAVGSGGPDRELALLRALVEFALADPPAMRLLAGEALAAGATGLRERDALIAQVGDIADSPGESLIDLPGNVLIGATLRFLAMGLAAQSLSPEAVDELLQWTATFRRAPQERSFSAGFIPTPPPAREPPAPPPPPGRPRERIVHALMAVVHRRGYRASTVGEIAAAAHVSRRQFYNEFACKADAFVAAYERGFELALARCGHAFFSAEEWPERVWASALAVAELLAREPALCQLGFVECHAVGRSFSRRVDDTQLAFTLFLEEGYRQTTAGASLSRTCSTLTASAIAEAAFIAARTSPRWYIRRVQPLAVYLALTPFIGSREAGLFVSGKLGTTTRRT